MSSNRRFLGIGVALGLVAGVLSGAGAVLAQGPAPSGAGAVLAQGPAPSGAVSTLPVPAGTPSAGASGSAVVGSAIAYPYPIIGGSPGVAPDHTIVVTGTGQADMKGDGSDRTAAVKAALAEALADAKVQANVIASGVGVSLKGVVSVSASVASYGAVVPLAGGAVPGQTMPEPIPPQPFSSQVGVSVTVEYAIG